MRPSYLGAVTLSAAGVVFGFLLTGLAPGDGAAAYTASPGYELWRVVMIGQSALFLLAVPVSVSRIRATLMDTGTRVLSKRVGLPALAVIALLYAPALFRPSFAPPLEYQWERMNVLLLMASVSAVCALLGFGACAAGFAKLIDVSPAERGAEGRANAVATYQRLRAETRWYLGLAGALVAVGMLGSGSFGLSLETFVDPNPLPTRRVLAYATYLSILLAIAYAPLHTIAAQAGREVRSVFAGEPLEEEFPKRWGELTKQLGLDAGLQGALESSVAVLAPLLAALFSELVVR